MMKKGQGLSMNVIIIAAIALLVLVIISVLVLRAGGNVNQSTGCTGIGGICVDSCDAQSGYIPDPTHGCGQDSGLTCCIKIGGG